MRNGKGKPPMEMKRRCVYERENVFMKRKMYL